MFITSFGEQNITYKCCSNFLIHLSSPVKIGSQVITWGETNSKRKHVAKNQIVLTKEQLKGKKYLAVHIYPDETVEITTSNDWPKPTEKGLKLLDQLRK